jgi:hypothetical protein
MAKGFFTRSSTWWTYLGPNGVMSTLFTLLASQWELVSEQGWAAIIIVGVVTGSLFLLGAAGCVWLLGHILKLWNKKTSDVVARESSRPIENKAGTSSSGANEEIFSYLVTHLFPQVKYVNGMVLSLSVSAGVRYPEMRETFELTRDSSLIEYYERHLEHLHAVDGPMTDLFVPYVKSYFGSIIKMEAMLGIVEENVDFSKSYQRWRAAHAVTVAELRELITKPYMKSAYDVLKREHGLFHS